MASLGIMTRVSLAVLMVYAGQVLACAPKTESQRPAPPTKPPTPGVCSNVALLHGTASDVRRGVLKTLCSKVHQHIHLKTSGTQRSPSNPKEHSKRTEQVAVLNIHRDSFSDQVKWEAGEASDVINTANWFVDEEIALNNGYNWYRNGLPLWPLLDQALTQKETILAKNKKLDWPNYAIATPLYLASLEASNSRDISISVQKLFAGDTVRTQQIIFKNNAKFQTAALDFVKENFQDQFGYTRADISQTFADNKHWIQPLVKKSLKPMLESFIKRQKTRAPKASDISMCPDEVYVFCLKKPCTSSNNCQFILDIQQELRLTNCVNTDVVVGYSPDTQRNSAHG